MGDFVSQSKFFIDGPFGNFQLVRVKSADVKSDKEVEVLTAVGVDGGAGYRRKTGGGEITLEVYREQGTPEVDYRAHENLGTLFAFTIQDIGGQRETYLSCTVANVGRKDDDAGSHMDTVLLKFLKRKPLPS
jgi:hypothetical protein